MKPAALTMLVVLCATSFVPFTCVRPYPFADGEHAASIAMLDVCHANGTGIVPASDMPCISNGFACTAVHLNVFVSAFAVPSLLKPFLIPSSKERPPQA
ncbi:MAG: hypothetical protein AB1805_00225 [Nitrospirota bacterium]